MKGRSVRVIGAAVALAGISTALLPLGNGSSAEAAQGATRAQAEKALKKRGFAKIRLRCSRNGSSLSCRWSAVRRRRPATLCRGTARVTPRRSGGSRVRIRSRCRRREDEPPPPGLPALGFNEDQSEKSFIVQRRTGATIRRAFVGWNVAELAPGSWDWSVFDAHYKLMREANIRPLYVAIAAPCWANAAACASGAVHYPPDRAHERDWSEFVRRLTARYPEAAGIEIWNEPNFLPHWGPRVDPVRFAAILKLAFRAVKSANPRMPVISGGIVPIEETGAGGMADAEFIREMYSAGVAGHLDAIGYHPYPYYKPPGGSAAFYDPTVAARGLDRIGAAINGRAGQPPPVWITEVGISTTPPPGGIPPVSEARQATDLIALLRELGARGNIPTVVIHRLLDGQHNALTTFVGGGGSVASEAINSGFGVYHNDGSPKPAACSIARAYGGSQGC